jgi:hypothetical protein
VGHFSPHESGSESTGLIESGPNTDPKHLFKPRKKTLQSVPDTAPDEIFGNLVKLLRREQNFVHIFRHSVPKKRDALHITYAIYLSTRFFNMSEV